MPPDNTISVALPQTSTRVWLLRAIQILTVACAFLLILPYVLTPLYRVVDPVSTLMLWRWATRARVERMVTPIDVLAPTLSRTVIAAEDARFCSHHGIDFDELRGVLKAEADGVRRPRGASSITQQLAKNLFLWPGHSYIRKALEFPLALWIDFKLPALRNHEIDPQRQREFQRLADVTVPGPQEQVFGELLGDAGAAAPPAHAVGLVLEHAPQFVEIDSMMAAKTSVFAN